MTRDRWIALARLELVRFAALPASQRRYCPAPTPVRVPPAELLTLLDAQEATP